VGVGGAIGEAVGAAVGAAPEAWVTGKSEERAKTGRGWPRGGACSASSATQLRQRPLSGTPPSCWDAGKLFPRPRSFRATSWVDELSMIRAHLAPRCRWRTAGRKTSFHHLSYTCLSIHAFFWSKYGNGPSLPSPRKHSGRAAEPIMATGHLCAPVALVHSTSVTLSILCMALEPRASRRSRRGTYDREGRHSYNSPVSSML